MEGQHKKVLRGTPKAHRAAHTDDREKHTDSAAMADDSSLKRKRKTRLRELPSRAVLELRRLAQRLRKLRADFGRRWRGPLEEAARRGLEHLEDRSGEGTAIAHEGTDPGPMRLSVEAEILDSTHGRT